MDAKAINKFPIREYLASRGIRPAKDRSYCGLYHSPLREDHMPSMKVDYDKNLWIDYGAGEGGTLIDLVMHMERCDAGEALTGRYVGAHNRADLERMIRALFAWGIGLALTFTILYGIGGSSFLGLLTNEREVLNASSDYFYWVLAIPLAGMAAFLWDGIYIGATASRQMLYSMLVASASFFLLQGLLQQQMGNHALWMAFIVYLFLRGLVQTGLARKILLKSER